jgi:ribosomal protein S21
MVRVQKKDKETDENLLRRFTRRVQQTRVLALARKRRYRKEEKSKVNRRKEALYKTEIRGKIEKVKKMGHFDEETLRDIKKKMRKR